MPLQMINQINMTEGIGQVFLYVNNVTYGLFINMVLFSIWCIVTFGIYFVDKKTGRNGSLSKSLAASAFVLIVSTILLSLIHGMVPPYTWPIVIVVGVISILMFLFSSNN